MMADPHYQQSRDVPLALRWQGRDDWRVVNSMLGYPTESETFAAFAIELGAEAITGRRWVSYSRNKAHYQGPKRYRSQLRSHAKVVGAADRLDDYGLVDHAKSVPGQRGRQSSMCTKPELISLARPVFERVLIHRKPREPIILRDANKVDTDYRDTRQTTPMRWEVEAQNEAITSVNLGSDYMVSIASPMRRIFNEKFAHGGRFYAEGSSWQHLPPTKRGQLQIDGEPVTENDYCQIHTAFCYSILGRTIPPDAYHIKGVPRPLAKIAFCILLNSSQRNGACHTLAERPEMASLFIGQGNAAAIPYKKARDKAVWIIERLEQKHAAISSLFYKGIGLQLQRTDSDIAAGVMGVLRKRGIVAFPVHDSFIVPRSQGKILEGVMIDAGAKFRLTVKSN